MLNRRQFIQAASGLLLPTTAIARHARGVSYPSSGGGGTPSQVQIILQGVDYQGQSSSTTPPAPNHLSIGWLSVASATNYKIYRSVNQGAYSLYDTITASAATTAYSSYVSGSSTWSYQTGVDCAYQDTAATGCVSGTQGPTGGVFYAATSYTYKVSAVVGGVEGSLSTDSIFVFFANGIRIGCQDIFIGGFSTWSEANPGGTTSPGGYTNSTLFASVAGTTSFNPYSGGSVTNQNMWVGGFNYFNFNFYPVLVTPDQSVDIAIVRERSGDITIGPNLAITDYLTPTLNQWNALKLPLSTALADSEVGPQNGHTQPAFYKFTYGLNYTYNYYCECYFSVT